MEALTEVLPYLIGPAGGFIAIAVLFFLTMFSLWKIADKHIFPALAKWFDNQEIRYEKLLETHEADRELFKEAMTKITEEHKSNDVKLNNIKEELREIKYDIRTNNIRAM